MNVPKRPQTRRRWNFLKGWFLVRTGAPDGRGHWQGGPASDAGARCAACHNSLLLLWDINLVDPIFRDEPGPGFGRLRRLPLYYCWRCSDETCYRMTDTGSVVLLDPPVERPHAVEPQAGDYPYPGYPMAFPRVPLVLTRIPQEVQASLTNLQRGAGGKSAPPPGAEDLRRASGFLGRDVKQHSDLYRGQLGGLPWLVQDHEAAVCPVEECGTAMRELASIHNNPFDGMPMTETEAMIAADVAMYAMKPDRANYWVQVVYQICPTCLAIRAYNRVD